MSTKRSQQRLVLVSALTLVIAAAMGAAFYFGETSPVIAEGRVVIKPELVGQAQGMRTVYIIVRDPTSPMPMPYGAMATTISSDATGSVMEFKLTKDNLRIMSAASEHPKQIMIKARLDMDGLGGADTAGDIVGTVETIDWGSKNVEVTLNQLITDTPEPQNP